MSTILVEHQPNLMPYLGVWEKYFLSDIFVWADDVNFATKDYQHRVRITTPSGVKWLVISTNGKMTNLIKDVRIVDGGLNAVDGQLRFCYFKSFWYNKVHDFIESKNWNNERMMDFNIGLFDMIIDNSVLKNLRRPRVILESDLNSKTQKTERIVEHAVDLECDIYLSGIGGTNYLDVDLFGKSNVFLAFQKYEHPVYKQKFSDNFEKGMSIIDALANEYDFSDFIKMIEIKRDFMLKTKIYGGKSE